MAKGQVSEEDLAKGLQRLGSMSPLSSSKPNRDNPFLDTREPDVSPQAPPVEVPPQQQLEPVKPNTRSQVASISERRVQVADAPTQSVHDLSSVMPEVVGNTVMSQEVQPSHHDPEDAKTDSVTKAEVYSERVTVPLSSEMKVQLDLLAKELQKIRPRKDERITANTLMRVAITIFLESFEVSPVSCEKELLQLVRERTGARFE